MKKEYNRVFGVQIVYKDGLIQRELFHSVQLGNLIVSWKGTFSIVPDTFKNGFPLKHSNTEPIIEKLINYNNETVLINCNEIQYIKYEYNSGIAGTIKDKNVYDWDKTL